jgi:cupin fold WbuC family metalloprotein
MSSIDGIKEFPWAMNPPEGSVIVIDSHLVSEAIKISRRSPRGRIILPFHKSTDDALQRMLNILQPKSYIQPHCHKQPPKAESIVVVKGSICYVTFKENGEINRLFTLKAGSAKFGVDICADVYHTFFALDKDTVLFEVKPGPYNPDTDKTFAPWAPVEGSEESKEYLMKLYRLV